jgi:hypothetical protein
MFWAKKQLIEIYDAAVSSLCNVLYIIYVPISASAEAVKIQSSFFGLSNALRFTI